MLFLFCALGIGLLISTLSKTQQEAFLSSFLIFMPAMLLSGFMFPVTSMPKVFQLLTLVNPLRHFLEIVRGVFLKGVGFADVATSSAALAADRRRVADPFGRPLLSPLKGALSAGGGRASSAVRCRAASSPARRRRAGLRSAAGRRRRRAGLPGRWRKKERQLGQPLLGAAGC